MSESVGALSWRGLVPLHVLGMDLVPVNGYVVRSRGLIAAQLDAGARPSVVLPPLRSTPAAEAAEADWPFAGRLLRVEHPAAARREGGRRDAGDLLAAALHRGRRRLSRAGSVGSSGQGLGASHPSSAALRLARPLLDLEDRLLMRCLRRGLVALAPRLAPDLIHAHSPHRSGRPAVAAARALGLPVIYEVRGLWEESAVAEGRWRRGSAGYRAWRRRETRTMRRADGVVVIGEALRAEVLARGVAAERVFVVPNAVGAELAALAAASPAGSPEAGSPDTCTFGYVGSLRPLEGVEHLLRGVAASRRRGRDARALVVGGGEDVPRLERLAAELGLGGAAIFTGRQPHSRIAELYRRIDVFVVSRPDTLVARLVPPLKPLEAMAMGLPVVASDLPALREIVRPAVDGLLVPPEDAEAFAEAVEPLYDPLLRRRLGDHGRRWVLAERTWPAVLPAVAAAYAAVGEGRGGLR